MVAYFTIAKHTTTRCGGMGGVGHEKFASPASHEQAGLGASKRYFIKQWLTTVGLVDIKVNRRGK